MNNNEYANAQTPAKDPGETFGIVGMVLGIVSFFSNLGLVLPIAGFIFSYIAKKKSTEAGIENKYAKIGLIINGISLALGVLGYILLIIICIIYFALCFIYGFSLAFIGALV